MPLTDKEEQRDGIMLAFMLDGASTKALKGALPAGVDPVDDEYLHCTLLYLGNVLEAGFTQEKLLKAALEFAVFNQLIEGVVNGYGRFDDDGGEYPLYANFDAKELGTFRDLLRMHLLMNDIECPSEHGFTPHITLSYLPAGTTMPDVQIPAVKLRFDSLTLAWGGNHLDIPLGEDSYEEYAGQGGDPASVDGTFTLKQEGDHYRWVLISSSAYEDKDGEIVSKAALETDVARADADGDYGPLLFWHTGAQLGDCDFNAMEGKCLVESGTMSKAVGDALSRVKEEIGVSIKFLHPLDEPDADGVYHHIRRVERSLMPRHKASNNVAWLMSLKKENASMEKTKEDKLRGWLGPLADPILGKAKAAQDEAEASGMRSKAEGVKCPACGASNSDTATKCTACDASLPKGDGKDSGPPPAVQAKINAKEAGEAAPPPPPAAPPAAPAAAAPAPAPAAVSIGTMTPEQFVAVMAKGFEPLMAKLNELQPTAAKESAVVAKVDEVTDGMKLMAEAMGQRFKGIDEKIDELLGDAPAGVKSPGFRASNDPSTTTAKEAHRAPARDPLLSIIDAMDGVK